MASETTKKTTSKTKQSAAKESAANAAAAEETVPVEKQAAKRKPAAPKVDPNAIVSVRNGFQGMLIYISPHTKEQFVWESFGDEQDMELVELKRAKASCKDFFANNWFMFDEAWIPEYLGVSRYYQGAVSVDEFDAIFQMPAEELHEALEKMTDGQKLSAAYRAKLLYEEGQIDSMKSIEVLEQTLGISLADNHF